MEKLYHIILVVNKIAVRQTEDVSKASIDRVTSTFPYRLKDDLSNPYARRLRERDHILERRYDGIKGYKSGFVTPVKSVDVVIVDDSKDENGQALYYMFKLYENGEWKPNPNLSEEERRQMAKEYYAPLDLPLGRDRQAFLDIYADIKPYLTDLEYDYMKARWHALDKFTDEENKKYLEKTKKMPPDLALRVKYWFAHAHRNRISAPVSSISFEEMLRNKPEYYSHPWIMKSAAEKVQCANDCDFWYNTLLGTELENKMYTMKAEGLWKADLEDAAVDVLIGMLANKALSPAIRPIIEEKVQLLGYGRNMYNEIVRLNNEQKYQRTLDLTDKWIATSSGMIRKYLAKDVASIRNSCLRLLK